MRTVMKIQFVSPAATEATAAQISSILEEWASKKFRLEADGGVVIRKSGQRALFDRRRDQLRDQVMFSYLMVEPVSGGSLETHIKYLYNEPDLKFNCHLALGSENGLVLPSVEIRSPRFIKEVMDLDADWKIRPDGERVFSKVFRVGANQTHELSELVRSPDRRLPIVLVSELAGNTIGGDLHDRVARDLCGLAHVCKLSADGSWRLTETVGKEWSCYNGAVRLFWPFQQHNNRFGAHPLWTYDALLRRASNEFVARDIIRAELIDLVIEASTFVADDPALRNFETENSEAVSARKRAAASESGDMQALAELYAKENADLRAAAAVDALQIRTLQDNLEVLTRALRAGPVSGATQRLDHAPPQTVRDAVDAARAMYENELIFPDDLNKQIATLHDSAGPPDKLLRYFSVLSELSVLLRDGVALGKSVPVWLREKGVECSGDSETDKNNREAKAQRTFEVEGAELECEYHAKPSDKVPPDFCVRIYFTLSNRSRGVCIGYVGRHFA